MNEETQKEKEMERCDCTGPFVVEARIIVALAEAQAILEEESLEATESAQARSPACAAAADRLDCWSESRPREKQQRKRSCQECECCKEHVVNATSNHKGDTHTLATQACAS